MKKKRVFTVLGLVFLFILNTANANNCIWNSDSIVLTNNTVTKVISLKNSHFVTSSVKLNNDDWNYIDESAEFSVLVNGINLSGLNKWKILSVEEISDENDGDGLKVSIENDDEFPGLQLEIDYLLYPNLSVIRKQIHFHNKSKQEVKLESLNTDLLKAKFYFTHTWVMSNFARQRQYGGQKGNWNDPAMIVHDVEKQRGMVLGNEAPGVLKRTSALTDGKTLSIGLTHKNEEFPFRRWLDVDEYWSAPQTFIIAYNNTDDPKQILNNELNDYVRKHMGIRISDIEHKPTFVYNTWVPFNDEINEKLVLELVDVAAQCGLKEFIIDAGWFGSPEKNLGWTSVLGDYYLDRVKFPNGLKPIFDKIKARGMKPGLWLSLASASEVADVLIEHPEWFAQNQEGEITNLHNPDNTDLYTACMTTDWYSYIKNKIVSMIDEFGLAYVKIDLSVVTGAYVYDNEQSGCCAKNHAHKDREESLLMMYERTFELFDELHQLAPDLFIDCTFETAGKLQLIDYAIVKHAEGDWLSNFENPQPYNSLRVRNLAWNRSPLLPATALVIGNLKLEPPYYELVIASLLGSMPIVLGDLRKLDPDDVQRIKNWSDWIDENAERHDFLMYRQDVKGFSEPEPGNWDAYMRINKDTKSGGILGVFRNDAPESGRVVVIEDLEYNAVYNIYKAPSNTIVNAITGKELANKGFHVEIGGKEGFCVYEIRIQEK